MIINCICGKKKFRLSDELMPREGSKVRCGSCSEVWFFHPNKGNIEQDNYEDNNVNDAAVDNLSENTQSETVETPPVETDINQEINSDLIEKNDNFLVKDQNEEKISNFKIFTDSDEDLPSKEEMDKNLDQYKIDRDNNLNFFQKLFKKDRIKSASESLEKQKLKQLSDDEDDNDQARRTRLLIYLLFLLSIVLSVMLVPLRDDVTIFLPFMSSIFDFLTPVYEHIKGVLEFN